MIFKLILFLLSYGTIIHSFQPIVITTPYGSDTITEPILIELIHCPSMQRLKEIHQYGTIYYVKKNTKPYSRFEHSIGVFYLVRRFGASVLEQIAALLHDVSHTVFSHVGDHLFKHSSHLRSYQDDIHCEFIRKTEIETILKKYNISVEDINHKNGTFLFLEQDIPEICADRLEYILYGGLLENKLSSGEIAEIIDHISFIDGKWVFKKITSACKLADTALYLTEHVFGSDWNFVIYTFAAKALRRALKIGIITLRDIHHGTDVDIWDRLCQSSDPKIQHCISKLQRYEHIYRKVDNTEKCDISTTVKFRGIDPWIQTADGLQRLTACDHDFAVRYQAVKDRLAKGLYIKFLPH